MGARRQGAAAGARALPRHGQLEEVVAGLDVDLILSLWTVESALLLLKGPI